MQACLDSILLAVLKESEYFNPGTEKGKVNQWCRAGDLHQCSVVVRNADCGMT